MHERCSTARVGGRDDSGEPRAQYMNKKLLYIYIYTINILNSAGEKELGHSLGSRSLYCRKAHSRPRATRDLAETMNHRPPWTGHGPWAMM